MVGNFSDNSGANSRIHLEAHSRAIKIKYEKNISFHIYCDSKAVRASEIARVYYRLSSIIIVPSLLHSIITHQYNYLTSMLYF